MILVIGVSIYSNRRAVYTIEGDFDTYRRVVISLALDGVWAIDNRAYRSFNRQWYSQARAIVERDATENYTHFPPSLRSKFPKDSRDPSKPILFGSTRQQGAGRILEGSGTVPESPARFEVSRRLRDLRRGESGKVVLVWAGN
jgi:hypothetical protein